MEKHVIHINKKGDDGHKIISIRIKESVLNKIDDISHQTNRSRNELINILLENAIEEVEVD